MWIVPVVFLYIIVIGIFVGVNYFGPDAPVPFETAIAKGIKYGTAFYALIGGVISAVACLIWFIILVTGGPH